MSVLVTFRLRFSDLTCTKTSTTIRFRKTAVRAFREGPVIWSIPTTKRNERTSRHEATQSGGHTTPSPLDLETRILDLLRGAMFRVHRSWSELEAGRRCQCLSARDTNALVDIGYRSPQAPMFSIRGLCCPHYLATTTLSIESSLTYVYSYFTPAIAGLLD